MPGRRRVAATMILAAACATLAVGLAATATGCPSGCACKWKGGKQTVECVNMSLLTIPSGADTGTQVLDVSGNALETLSRGRFAAAGLSNLQRIYMARCRIRYVDDAAFRGLTNLVELDLSDNAIAEVPTKSFADYPQLMKLVLSGNAVTALRTAAFKRLKYLTVLDVSRCQVSAVEPGAFDGLQSLEWLRLDHNRIARIEGGGGGAAVLPLSLHGIEMHHNPWACDCRLRDVHRWLNDNGAPHTVEPTCHGPDRLRGSAVRKLAAEELACAPEAVAASPVYVETDAGKNVTLRCRVTPVGEARVSWRFEGRPVRAADNGTVADGPRLSIEDVGPANNGTYECVAENRAGRAACNFTVRVVQEPSEMAAGGSHPPAAPAPGLLVVALAAGSACLAASAVACAVTCRLTLAKRRRRRAKPDGAASGGDGESAGGDGPRTAKTAADIRQSDSVNLTTVSSVVADGKLSSAEDVCSAVYGDEYDPTSAVVPAGAAYEAHDAGPAGGYDPHGPFRAHDAAATTLEANPDLISDASTVVRDAGGGGRDGEVYKIAVPPEFWSGGVPAAAAAVFPSADAGYQLSSYNVSPRKSLAGDGGEPYPPDYGLPKMPARILQDGAMGYPPDYGLPKLRLYPPQPQPYRTLPHRRNAAKPQGRSCQEAEFVLLQQQHHHHHHHHQNAHHHHRDRRPDRYEPQNVRHNQQGYPYAAAVDAACYTSPAAFYEPPSLSNASAQTLDEETMTAMMMLQPSAGSRQRSQPAASGAAPEQQHRAVTSVQKQSANTESPDEGYVGEGPDS